jgi:hypothetical protein
MPRWLCELILVVLAFLGGGYAARLRLSPGFVVGCFVVLVFYRAWSRRRWSVRMSRRLRGGSLDPSPADA